MTARAFGKRVQANQRKLNLVMVEGGAVRIESVVAGGAICPEGEDVFLRESIIHLQMAVGANELVNGLGKTVCVAVCAFE